MTNRTCPVCHEELLAGDKECVPDDIKRLRDFYRDARAVVDGFNTHKSPLEALRDLRAGHDNLCAESLKTVPKVKLLEKIICALRDQKNHAVFGLNPKYWLGLYDALGDQSDMEGSLTCGGSRCFLGTDGSQIHSTKSYGSCSVLGGHNAASCG